MADNAAKPNLEPAIFVIFGITGDLSRRYLLPALYHLIKSGLIHEQTEIVGVTRRNVTPKELLESMKLSSEEGSNKPDAKVLSKMLGMLNMWQMDLTKSNDYKQLKLKLD